jgi:hypothetical protein
MIIITLLLQTINKSRRLTDQFVSESTTLSFRQLICIIWSDKSISVSFGNFHIFETLLVDFPFSLTFFVIVPYLFMLWHIKETFTSKPK